MSGPNTVLEQFLAVVSEDPTYQLTPKLRGLEGYKIFCKIVRIYHSQDARDITHGLTQLIPPESLKRLCKTQINRLEKNRPKIKPGRREMVNGEKVSKRPEKPWLDQHNICCLERWLGKLPLHITGPLPPPYLRETKHQVNPRASKANKEPVAPLQHEAGSLQRQAEVSPVGQAPLEQLCELPISFEEVMERMGEWDIPLPASWAQFGDSSAQDPVVLESGAVPDLTAGHSESSSPPKEPEEQVSSSPSQFISLVQNQIPETSHERMAWIEQRLLFEFDVPGCPDRPADCKVSPLDWWKIYLARNWQGDDKFQVLTGVGMSLDQMLQMEGRFDLQNTPPLATVNPQCLFYNPPDLPLV